jgi:plasmid stabilization system protein ParE
VAQVELARGAVADLDRLILTHSLPADTRERVKRSLHPLGRFPRLGAVIDEQRPDERFVIGPWPWLIVVYQHRESEDRVVVLSIEDGRSSRATTARSAK